MLQQDLELEIATAKDSYVFPGPLMVEIRLMNSGRSPLYLYRYGLEVGLQLHLEVLDEEGHTLLVPPLVSVEPDLSREQFLELAPRQSWVSTIDIGPLLESGLTWASPVVLVRFSYSGRRYGDYAREKHGINAFTGQVVSNQLRIHLRPQADR